MQKPDQKMVNRISERVARLREIKGLTQRELAARADMQHAALARIESGQGNPTLQTLERIATGLDVPLISLFSVDSTTESLSRRDLKALVDALPDEMVPKAARILQVLGT